MLAKQSLVESLFNIWNYQIAKNRVIRLDLFLPRRAKTKSAKNGGNIDNWRWLRSGKFKLLGSSKSLNKTRRKVKSERLFVSLIFYICHKFLWMSTTLYRAAALGGIIWKKTTDTEKANKAKFPRYAGFFNDLTSHLMTHINCPMLF